MSTMLVPLSSSRHLGGQPPHKKERAHILTLAEKHTACTRGGALTADICSGRFSVILEGRDGPIAGTALVDAGFTS